MTALMRYAIQMLRLRPDAPWPSELSAERAAICARRVESDPMKLPHAHPIPAPFLPR